MKLEAAAEKMATAQKQGATQRKIARGVGKSLGWVNRLLKWREGGYQGDSPFGPQSRASRQRARVQSAERKKQKPATTSEQAKAAEARARAERTKAEAEKRKAEAEKSKADAAKARAEKERAQAEASKAFWAAYDRDTKKLPTNPRGLLIKLLGMLGSDHPGERANAARLVEKQRIKLDMTWEQLIIPAAEAETEDEMAA